MASREAFHDLLVNALGSRYVYFQSPESSRMQYPCIIYKIDDKWVKHADDKKYIGKNKYTVTLIDFDPDSTEIISKLEEFEYCEFNRSYASDNLNHFVYTIFY